MVLLGSEGKEVLACQYNVYQDLEVYLAPAPPDEGQILVSTSIPVATGLHPGTGHGVACDIGTTTVVACLHELASGKELACAATTNPQAAYGADVISRIHYASTEQGRRVMQGLIVACINHLIGQLATEARIDPVQIGQMCVVGNTTMMHLFLGLPVDQLGQAPYRPFSVQAADVPAARLGLDLAPDAQVHVVDSIAGFVGADTTAVGLAVGIDQAEEGTLVLDVGTNGELLLAAGGQVLAASCAAGPAFEGASIHNGSRAVEGAIERAWLQDQDLDVTTIGDKPARSICGSGLVDLIACLLDLGLLDRTGRLAGPDSMQPDLPAVMAKRVSTYRGQPAFVVAADVILTQSDIRQVQLAKAAIRAGIEVMLLKAGMRASDLKRVLLAGAFGQYINVRSAIRIGLLPGLEQDRVQAIGNAALAGARMVLLDGRLRAKASAIARSIRYIELATDPLFASAFSSAMQF